MNHIYRVIWNAVSATWTAVAETARGNGKSSKAATRRRAAVAFGALALIPPFTLAQVASVVVVPGTNLNAVVAPNGVTVVNINQANAAGLSHNRYNSFNVNPIGLILNNTTSAQQIAWQSQLAGQVMANFNQSSAARVILNEVVSNNRSTLAGFTEVLGGRADVVLANPYGITCSGCGFINTDRVTLSTGNPFLASNGGLGGFSVGQGDILITGTGLNATAQQVLDLVTRSVRIEAPLNGQDVSIVTGTNRWDYGTRAITGSADAVGGAPVYSIDTAVLGGMYANRIRMTSTEAGVGVRMLGDAAASAGDFTLTTAGSVELRNRISAATDVNVSTTDNGASALALTDASLTSTGKTTLAAAGGATITGSAIVAGTDLSVSAASLLDTASASGITNNNLRHAGGALTLAVSQAASVNATQWRAGGNWQGQFGSIATGAGARFTAGGNMVANSGADMNLGAALWQAGGDLTLRSAGQLRTTADSGQGVQSIGGQLRIEAGQGLDNGGAISADAGATTLRVNGRIDNSGTVNAGGALDIAARDSGSTLTLDNNGNLLAGGALTLLANSVGNQGTLRGGSAQIGASEGLTNAGLISIENGSAALRVGNTLTNTGAIRASHDLTLTDFAGGGSQALANSGYLLAGGALALNAAAIANDNKGWIQAATGSTVNAASLVTAGDWLLSQQAGGTDTLTVTGALGNSGTLQSGGNAHMTANAIANQGAMLASGQLDIASGTDFDHAAGATTQAGQNLSVSAIGKIDVGAHGGLQSSTGDVALTAGNGLANAGTVTATQGATTLRIDGAIDNSGTVNAGTAIDIADRSGGGSATLVNTATGLIQAGTHSTVKVASLDNAGALLLSLQGGGASSVAVGGTLDNSGVIYAKQNATVTADRIANRANATLRADGDLALQAANGLTNAGAVRAGATLGVASDAWLDNQAAGTLIGDRLNVAVASFDNAGVVQGGSSSASMVAVTDTFTNQIGGVLTAATTAGGSGTVAAAKIANEGSLQSVGGLTLALGADGLAGNGDVLAAGNLGLQARGGNAYSAHVGGTLQSGGLLSVQGNAASVLSIAAGKTASGETADIDIGSVTLARSAVLASSAGMDLNADSLTLAGDTDATARVMAATGGTGTGNITVTSALTNNGLLFSGNDLNVNAPHITNSATGGIAALNNLTIRANAGMLDLGAATPDASAGKLNNNGALYAGNTLSAQANGTLTNTSNINAGSAVLLRANTLINNRDIVSDGDIQIVAATLRNEVPGGDTRVQTTSATNTVADGGEYSNNPSGNKYVYRNYVSTWTVSEAYSGGAPTYSPQIGAANHLTLAFNNCSNLGGTIYGGRTIALQGFSVDASQTDSNLFKDQGVWDDRGQGFKLTGGTFTNDNLALRTQSYTRRYTQVTKYVLLGPVKDYENRTCGVDADVRPGTGCTYNNPQTSHQDTADNGLRAGLYTLSLTGNGFSLINNGSSAQPVTQGALTAAVEGAVKPDGAAGIKVPTPDAQAWGGIRAQPQGPSVAPGEQAVSVAVLATLNGISFLSANAANGVRGTAFGGINIPLPTNPNGYYVRARDPGAKYLVESNPLYMVGTSNVGSDYLSKLLGYNADQIGLRLGDASYEAYLVKQQLVSQTGNVILAQYANADAQMQGLMETAAGEATALGLQYGRALTPEQQARLKGDIVWMVQTEIEGKTVLAPVVYLAQSTRNNIASGAVISAQDANLSLTSLTNTGGSIVGGKSLVIASLGDISNLSGLIKGGDVSLTSTSGSIINKTLSSGSGGDQFYTTTIGKTAGIVSTGSLALDAKKDITNLGANIAAGTDASLKAGDNITFDTIENKTTGTTGSVFKADGGTGRTVSTTTTVEQVKSGLTVGGNLSADAGKDITLAGTVARVGGNADLKAGDDINIVARENSTVTNTVSKASGFGMNNSLHGSTTVTTNSTSIRNVGSSLEVGGNASMAAKNDITVQGSDVNVAGDGSLSATNVKVLAGRNYDESTTTTKQSGVMQVGASSSRSTDSNAAAKSAAQRKNGNASASASASADASASGKGSAGLAFSSTTTTSKKTTDLQHVGSNLSFGGNLQVDAKQDLTLQGSKVAAGGDATINAQNVNLLAAEDKKTSTTSVSTTKIGLLASSDNKAQAGGQASAGAFGGKGIPNANAGASAGASVTSENRLDLVQKSTSTTTELNTRNQGSAISSGGNLDITATNALNVEGSNLASGKDMVLDAKDMTFKAVTDRSETRTSSSVTTAGLYATGKASASAKANATAGLGAQASASGGVSASGEVGIYGSNTRTTSLDGSTTAQTSGISSGGSLARRAGNAITDVGTQIDVGGDLNQSAKTITSLAAADTTYSSSSSKTDTAKIGVYAEASADMSVTGAVGPGASKPKQSGNDRARACAPATSTTPNPKSRTAARRWCRTSGSAATSTASRAARPRWKARTSPPART